MDLCPSKRRREMAEPITLNSLPEDVMLHIFEFCDFQDLGRLARTCRHLRHFIKNADSLWIKKSKYVLGSNMSHPAMKARCKPILPLSERCRLSKSWQHGAGDIRLAYEFYRCLPWMYLEANTVYCSKGTDIVTFFRDDDGCIKGTRRRYLKPNIRPFVDITKFTVLENEIIIGFANGIIGRWEKDQFYCIERFLGHDDQIFSVHAQNDIILTGSRDKKIKIWRRTQKGMELKKTLLMNVRVLSTAIMPSNSCLIAGLPGTENIHPLQMFDIESGQHLTNFGSRFRNGAGILQIYPEDQNTFLCGGYDTTIKLWDIRCPKTYCGSWMEPFDNSIYSLSSDQNVTIISGACRNSYVHIWDKRLSGFKHIFQVSKLNSPVYCLDFDATHIFVALFPCVIQHSYIWCFLNFHAKCSDIFETEVYLSPYT